MTAFDRSPKSARQYGNYPMPDIVHTTTPTATRSTMSLAEHVEQSSDPNKKARAALLTAIASDVEENSKASSIDHRIARLKLLSEAYALVVHGKD